MHIRTPREIGALIRDRRKALELDQQTLASRVGVSRKWLIEVERGKARAELGLVLRTLAALGLVVSVEPQPATRPRNTAVPDIDEIVAAARKKRR